ncbi:hypothetical protein SPRG_12731 [Saprolegnia parasitica CBS 223.65]|uniref:GOST seven transmembrane domain-containing protein n=1 Tax=Saprolegnia parasitica (strain CBS 223.65) TaxID=695850 RepID=A0A067C013_SAPPC|nr:hypothetical protein SPRG_12731 [Saprolegnia parasitica CBS 223.65]KDO22450.1 hypothetical protein SPRG_12731 [Saprolegnia parasitica CBS 223.65]|eukprot:XP_012206838.1 hypothetical protein SPRG_12731 [Saprolegnia parasitica CBS 223.65]
MAGSLRRCFTALLLGAHAAYGSVYPVSNELIVDATAPADAKVAYFPFQRAEKMFGSNHGPLFAEHGSSSVHLNISGVNASSAMNGGRLVVFHYQADNLNALADAEGNLALFACSQLQSELTMAGMHHLERREFPIVNGSVVASTTYKINSSGWIDSLVFVCSETHASQAAVPFTGTLTVRNPYGLLPAVFYGLLPFSGFLSLGYLVLAFFFAILLCLHRKEAIALQVGIFAVLLLGTVSSAIWFIALYEMNQVGQPFSWPLPPLYIAAVACDAGMRTFARMILLVVCLGYGIVKDTLPRLDKVLIVVMSLAYFGTGVADDLIREATADRSSGLRGRSPSIWALLQLACNLVFVLWIYLSLETILKDLRSAKQFAKLKMYEALAYSLGGFVLFFTMLTAVAVSGRVGLFEWPTEWEWTQLVAWPVLNFIVSAAMCVIWRPTARSIAYASQLPMEDIEDDEQEHEDDDTKDKKDAVANISPRFTVGEDDDDEHVLHSKV